MPSGFKHQPPAAAISYGFGWSRISTCEIDDLVTHGGAIDSYRSDIRFSPSRGVGVVALTNFGNANPGAIAERAMMELAKTGALEKRAAQPSPVMGEALTRLLAASRHRRRSRRSGRRSCRCTRSGTTSSSRSTSRRGR